MKLPVYLDYHATTPVDPRVMESMLPYFTERFGNPASASHAYGWEAESAVQHARAQVAAVIGADPSEILFTGGASESNNLVIKGIAESYARKGDHIVTTTIEHKSVLESCMHLARVGKIRVTWIPPERSGKVDPERIAAALTGRTILVSIIHSHNEIGTIQDLAPVASLCAERDILFHTDATQSFGKTDVNVDREGVDFASFSAHKFYGPKGIGCLYIRKRNKRIRLAPLVDGGGQEMGIRSGTVNVPAVVGMGRAAELCAESMPAEIPRLRRQRDALRDALFAALPDMHVNGHPTDRLPGNLSVRFDGVRSDLLAGETKDLAFSTGAACTSESLEVSYVLKAIGCTTEEARATIRLGLGRFTTEEEIAYTYGRIIESVGNIRAASFHGERSRPIQSPQ